MVFGYPLRYFYAAIQLIGLAILIGELIYVCLQKPSLIQKHFIIILFSVAIADIGYFIELIAQSEETAFIGCSVGYCGKPFALLASLLLLLEYSNIHVDKKIIIGLTLFLVGITVIEFTTTNTKLYYTSYTFDPTKPGSPLKIDGHGPFWYVYMAASLLIFLAFSAAAYYESKQSRTKQAKQMAALLFVSVLLSFLGLFLYLADVTYNYDSTLLGILLGTIILLILFTKYRMFDTIGDAQHKSLNESNDGVIILDARLVLSFYNNVACSIIPELKVFKSRKDEGKIVNLLETLKEDEVFNVEGKIYSLKINNSYSRNGTILVGRTYKFNEITEHFNYQEKLNEEIKLASNKILKLRRDALISIADIVEARDGNTGMHIKSVATTAEAIALELRKNRRYTHLLTPEFIKILKECAPLHDIGKIYISDVVLNKPGKLTDEEREIMKTHTTKGAEMIRKTMTGLEEPDYIKVCEEIALCHHEWFDGSGYPKKLKGEKIPLSARILAVADVYDALRMKRPYKDPFSKEKAIEIIKEETPKHFDPAVVEAFLKVLDSL